MHRLLEEARGLRGGPRFYPAGEHPATYRARVMLRKMQELGMGSDPAAIYCEEQIAAIEQGELVAKARYLRAQLGRV